MSKILGLWNSSWPNQGEDFPKEFEDRVFNQFEAPAAVIQYLDNGHKLISQRRMEISFYGDGFIGAPYIICDNLFVWTSEYAHYVKNGLIEIDQLLFENIYQNDCIVPDLNSSDLNIINQILSDYGFSPLARVPLIHPQQNK